jgi:hypothetical protein
MSRGVSASIREVMGASRVALGRLPARLQSLLTPGRQGGGTRQGELPRLPDELPQPDESNRRHLVGRSDHCELTTVRQRWIVRADIRDSRPASGAGDVPAGAGVVPVLAVAARLAFAPSGGGDPLRDRGRGHGRLTRRHDRGGFGGAGGGAIGLEPAGPASARQRLRSAA